MKIKQNDVWSYKYANTHIAKSEQIEIVFHSPRFLIINHQIENEPLLINFRLGCAKPIHTNSAFFVTHKLIDWLSFFQSAFFLYYIRR